MIATTARRIRLRSVLFALILALLTAGLVTVGARPALAALGAKDYPTSIAGCTKPPGGGQTYTCDLADSAQDSWVDPWDFYNRECTSFVAWRLNNNNGVTFKDTMTVNGKTATWGNAYHWTTAATTLGYTYNTIPAVGSVAWWGKNADGGYAGPDGHVAYVDSIAYNSNGTVSSISTEDYNSADNGNYATHTYAVGSQDWPVEFIHIKDIVGSPPPNTGPGNIYVGSNQMTATSYLYPNRYLLSPDSRFMLILQSDSNLVEYGPGDTVEWQSQTNGASPAAAYAAMQSDGNFVLYNTNRIHIFGTGTSGSGATHIVLGDDGSLTLKDSNNNVVYTIYGGGQGNGFTNEGSQLGSGSQLQEGQYLQSSDGRFTLDMQTDGNLVLYGPAQTWLWGSATSRLSGVSYAALNSNGDLALFDSQGNQLWSLGVSGASTATVQSDGNFCLNNSSGGVVWCSHTGGQIVNAGSVLDAGGDLYPNYYLLSTDTRFVFIQQSDGNLVLYDCTNESLWSNGKKGTNVGFTALQSTDGNLVEYNNSSPPGVIWSPYVSGGAHLDMQSDGNLVLYEADWATVVFKTNTGGAGNCIAG